ELDHAARDGGDVVDAPAADSDRDTATRFYAGGEAGGGESFANLGGNVGDAAIGKGLADQAETGELHVNVILAPVRSFLRSPANWSCAPVRGGARHAPGEVRDGPRCLRRLAGSGCKKADRTESEALMQPVRCRIVRANIERDVCVQDVVVLDFRNRRKIVNGRRPYGILDAHRGCRFPRG